MIKENVNLLIKNFVHGLGKEVGLGHHPTASAMFVPALKIYGVKLESEGMASETLELNPEEFKVFRDRMRAAGISVTVK